MARGKLKIADEISLPLDAVTQTFGFIGRKGAGKTYLATMVAEHMLDAKAQAIVIDPVGVWWGLRVNADGKTKGKQIFVIGGDHGDVPLVPEAGARIAQLIVEKGISAVLDVSGFRIGERKRFCQDFGEEFFQLKKKKRTPAHIFLEEAQLIVPQNIRPDETRMYSAFEQIVRLGRNYGIGCSLITQRPQSVNKEVLSQVECLCVLQMTGPHERKAIEYWVQESGADRALIGELPGLERGEGFVWSPSWLRIYKRVHFSKKQTFDASATPEIGKKTKAASLSAVDVEALKIDIADVVAQAEKDDPIALRKQIAKLEEDLKNRPPADTDPKVIERAVAAALKEQAAAFEQERAQYRGALTNASTTLKKIAELTARPEVQELVAGAKISPIQIVATKEIKKEDIKQIKPGAIVSRPADSIVAPIGDLRPGARKILDVVVARHPMKLTRVQVALFSQFSVNGGSFSSYLSELRKAGMIELEQNTVSATAAGITAASVSPGAPQSAAEVVEMWRKALRPGEVRMLDVLRESGDWMEKEELGDRAGSSASGGSFSSYLSVLRRNEIVEVDKNRVRISRDLV